MPRDYEAFIDSVEGIVRAQGKVMIGWEEIAQAPIDSGTIVQHWRSGDLAVLAASKGAQILMSPSTRVYLDMKYDAATVLGQNWANYIEVDTAYMWDPVTLIPALDPAKVLGIIAPLWTETVATWNEAELLLFPAAGGDRGGGLVPGGRPRVGRVQPATRAPRCSNDRHGDTLLPFAPRPVAGRISRHHDQRALCRDRDRTFRSRGEDPCPARPACVDRVGAVVAGRSRRSAASASSSTTRCSRRRRCRRRSIMRRRWRASSARRRCASTAAGWSGCGRRSRDRR